MKTLITIIIMLVAAGCGKSLTEEEKKVVGSYGTKKGGDAGKLVLLKNGKVESYSNGEKVKEDTWKIVGNEVHVFESLPIELVEKGKSMVNVFKIEPNGDLIYFAKIYDGKRTDLSKVGIEQTWKKLKE